jgi:hypothetical protein
VIAHDQYRVVFDLYQKGFDWWFPAIGLLFMFIGGIFVWFGSKKGLRSRRMEGYFLIGFACLWSGVTFSSMLREDVALRSAYRRSQFSVVEGRVTDFHPMPYQGHQSECFSVRSQTFCYSDYVVTAGFNNSASHGGLSVRDFLSGFLTSEIRLFVWKSGAMRCPVTLKKLNKTSWLA